MTESMLQSLMKLFAIIASINKETVSVLAGNFVDSYLNQQYSPNLAKKYLEVFEKSYDKFERSVQNEEGKRTSSLSVKVISICEQINEELHLIDRFQILLNLIQFVKFFDTNAAFHTAFKQSISDTVETIAEGLMINQEEYKNCWSFIAESFYEVPGKDRLLIISGASAINFSQINHLQKNNFKGQIYVLKIEQENLFLLYYIGDVKLEINGQYIYPRYVYILPKGAAIRGEEISPVYYSDIVSAYLKNLNDKVFLHADNIDFRFKNSENGIHQFSFQAESGQLVGIMGGSGTGKSTLIKILNGSIKIRNGQVLINGYELHDEKENLDGIIGFVPQDDLLIAELTVYQNLYYNAKLCFGNLSNEEIRRRVVKVLSELDLFHIKNLLVGSPLNKFISGGQRKRLNIALELIREPNILFIDEPTSGLSSTDSENVLQLLKDQTLKGKLVVINIHQPSSDLFKLFDKLLVMDKGGYPVYYGDPMESLIYFKRMSRRVGSEETECYACGTVQTEDILKILEEKKVNRKGEHIDERKTDPITWYGFFREELQKNLPGPGDKASLPEKNFERPNRLKQFSNFSKRNFLSKIVDRQYLILALGIAPLLAVILGFFTKYYSGSESSSVAYVFSKNENLPAYLFMCVIVALFIGMILSAEEIIKDSKILERESFLNLSRISYLNSKIFFLTLLTAFQMFMFVFIGNAILEVKGLNFNYWIVLFSTGMFANMLGLNISSSLKSVIAIYITIPFILVPFILLAGIIVKYDKLHFRVASAEFVPVVGDLMPSKWAYEALVVNQFSNNDYQKHFNEVDEKIENRSYELDYLIPEVMVKIRSAETAIENNQNNDIISLGNTIEKALSGIQGIQKESAQFEGTVPDKAWFSNLKIYLENFKIELSKQISSLKYQKDEIIENFITQGMTMKEIAAMKREYHNNAVGDLVLNSNEFKKVYEYEGALIQKAVPVFKKPDSRKGRAHFYAGYKIIGNHRMNTLWFNTGVLWSMTLVMYLILIGDFGRKISGVISRYHERRKF